MFAVSLCRRLPRAGLLAVLALGLGLGARAGGSGPRVIIDTDIDSDVDDVQALAVAHALATRGDIELLGMIVTSDDPFAATCVSAINRYYGRPELPVGFLRDQPVLTNRSRYTRQLSAEFPHALARHEDAADSTALYRQLLAGSPDGSVVLVTLGHLTSLQRLLESSADAHSPLDGRTLAARKVRHWICMGGRFPGGKEANFYRPDPGATVACLREWPGAVTFCGWEAGEPIKTGGAYLRATLPPASPVYRAYQLFNDFAGRASWDQLAVLLLAPDAARFFDFVSGGRCHVFADGSNEWRPGETSRHRYLTLKPGATPEEIGRQLDDLSRPPQ